MNSSRSKTLYERAKRLMPGGVSSPVRAYEPYPFFTKLAKGSKIYDVDGKAYIDLCMAYGALIFGHASKTTVEAVKEQVRRGAIYGTPTEAEVELADLLTRAVPSIEMVRLVNTGTEATMHAIRAARSFTGRDKVVKLEGCYHGAHDYVLVKAGPGAASFGTPTSAGIPKDAIMNTIVLPYNDAEALDGAIERERGYLAALIMEPVMANAGMIPPKEGYLQAVRKLTEENGIVLIFDEVVTGFRLSFGGAQEYFRVTPDMTTLSKVMGGGLPVAAFGGKREIMEHISPSGKVYQAGTFSGNPLSSVAGLAALKLLSKNRESIYPRLSRMGDMVRRGFEDAIKDRKFDAHLNSLASMFQIFFTRGPVQDYRSALASDTGKYMKYFHLLLESGVFVPPSQFETCFLSTAHSKEDVLKVSEAFDAAIKQMAG